MSFTDAYPTTPGSGRAVAVDHELTMPDATVADVQMVKIALGAAQALVALASGRDLGGGDGALYVDQRRLITQTAWQTPVITAGAYTAGMAIGGLITFPNAARAAGGTGRIKNILMIDEDKTNTNLKIIFFGQAPSVPTDHTAYDPSLSDAEKMTALFTSGGAWVDLVSRALYSDMNYDWGEDTIPYSLVGGTDLFAVIVANGTPTFTGTSSLRVALLLELD